jgi:hypothetical protein
MTEQKEPPKKELEGRCKHQVDELCYLPVHLSCEHQEKNRDGFVYCSPQYRTRPLPSALTQDTTGQPKIMVCGNCTPEQRHLYDEKIRQDERIKVYDELGVLHGEDAKRFTYEMEHPEPVTNRESEMVKRAYEIIENDKRKAEAGIRQSAREEVINEIQKLIAVDNWLCCYPVGENKDCSKPLLSCAECWREFFESLRKKEEPG